MIYPTAAYTSCHILFQWHGVNVIKQSVHGQPILMTEHPSFDDIFSCQYTLYIKWSWYIQLFVYNQLVVGGVQAIIHEKPQWRYGVKATGKRTTYKTWFDLHSCPIITVHKLVGAVYRYVVCGRWPLKICGRWLPPKMWEMGDDPWNLGDDSP